LVFGKIWLLLHSLFKKEALGFQFQGFWRVSISVSTQGFHSCRMSSTLIRATKKQIRLKIMANHRSALKAFRKSEKRRLHNRYYAKTMRNAVRKLRAMTDKEEAIAAYPKVQKMLDKMAKTRIIHKNKAANLKSKLSAHIAKLD
jgi:small subunit ribosomal protein S20